MYMSSFTMKRIKSLSFIMATLMLFLVLFLTACFSSQREPASREGERYFEADVDFEYAESCTVSFILSADRRSVRDVQVLILNLDYELPYEGRMIGENNAGQQIFVGDGELDEQNSVEITAYNAVIRLTIGESVISGELDYIYRNSLTKRPKFELFVGTFPFEIEIADNF